MVRWYLIHTKPLGERIAQCNLERQGYGVYFPRLLRRGVYGRHQRERIDPLFPRYLFLGLHHAQQSLAPVRSTVGVARVVRFGCEYAVVPPDVIYALQSRADPASGLHQLTHWSPLRAGSPVRIVQGPFAGLEGIFEREVGSDRVDVLLEVLGRQTPVRVPAHLVEPSEAA